MRVVHYRNVFSPLSQTFIYDYISELEKKGIDNYVATHKHINKKDRPFGNVLKIQSPGRWNIERLFRRFWGILNNKKSNLASWPQKRKALKRNLKKIKPDLIHAHFGPEGVVIGPVAEELNIPLAVSFYGYDISTLIRDQFWVKQYQKAFEASDVVIGISNHICSKLERLGVDKEKIKLLHLGIEVSNFSYQKASNKVDGVIRCVHVGRLVEKKSPLNLVRAFKHATGIINQDFDLRLKIAGDGPLKNELQKEVKKLNLENQIDVLGAVSHSEVPKLLEEADIYTQHCVTASNGDQEGQGVSFVEASATGLPIVATKHNGLPDVILDKKTGYLVEEGDYEAMGEKIAYLADNFEVREKFGQRGRKHIEENFSLLKQSRKAISTYKKTLE